MKHNIFKTQLKIILSVVGFTFSFPMHQKSLSCGLLVTWTKSFKTSGVEKEDVVQLLREAIERRGDNHVEVVAILNDTTGTNIKANYHTLIHYGFSKTMGEILMKVDIRILSKIQTES